MYAAEIDGMAGMGEARFHAVDDALGGERRRVAAGAEGFASLDMGGLLGHPVNELDVHADIFRGDIRTLEGIDKATHGAGFRFGLRMTRGGQQDDAFRPAHGKIGAGGFVRHALGETQDVVECVGFGGVMPAPGAPQPVSEFGGMDSDDRPQTGLRIIMKADTLVSEVNHLFKGVHGVFRIQVRREHADSRSFSCRRCRQAAWWYMMSSGHVSRLDGGAGSELLNVGLIRFKPLAEDRLIRGLFRDHIIRRGKGVNVA